MSERLSQKEIKHDIREDEFRSFVGRVFEKIEEKPSLVFGTVAGIVAVILLVTGFLAFSKSRAETANQNLAEALEIIGAPIVEDGEEAAPTASDSPTFTSLEERRASAQVALDNVSSGAAAEVAELLRADLALEEGDRETARGIWENFVSSQGEHLLALSVRLNLIHLDRAEGQASKVAEELQQELNSTQKRLPEDVILYELALTREALGETEIALELYQRIVDEYPQSPYTGKARQMTTAAG
jgi:tetratricopeptide (TPR) repeat protein